MGTLRVRVACLMVFGAAAWLLAACGTAESLSSDGSGEATPPPDDEPALVLEAADGSTPQPGEIAEIVYLVPDDRGLPHTLQRWDGRGWDDLLHGVATDYGDAVEERGFAEDPGTRWTDDLDEIATIDIGFVGTGGGLFLTLPEAARGEIVRLCMETLHPEDPPQLCSDAYDYR